MTVSALTIILYVFVAASAIVSLVCGIMVLVQMFKKGGVGMGILGLLTCFLGAYIWGWIKSRELQLTKIMLAWTAAIVVSFIANLFGGVMAAQTLAKDPEFQRAYQEALEQQQQPEAPVEVPVETPVETPQTPEPAPQN